jgi:nitrite reductase (NO-forming)
MRRPTLSHALVLLFTLAAVVVAVRIGARRVHGADTAVAIAAAPMAEVFTDAYAGPPVVGRVASHLPALAALDPGTTVHQVRVDIVAQEIDVAPGVRYQAWTFGGSVPGPVLHVRQGDRVAFTMKNRTNERVLVTRPDAEASPFSAEAPGDPLQSPTPLVMPMHHSIDFHAASVAPNDKWRMIQPGDSIRFQWVANYPGVYLYHCGVPPILMHMSMGQYGVVVVSPRDGYPTDAEVARSYVVVQSEFYLKPGDHDETISVLDYDAAYAKQPSQVVFNGNTQALVHTPLQAKAGERVRLYVLNAGPSGTSSFHVVGAIFDRVYYEGNPQNDWHGMQTVLLGASNGAVVEFVVPEAGDYVIVDHEFADAQRGAVGYLHVTGADGTPSPLAAMRH